MTTRSSTKRSPLLRLITSAILGMLAGQALAAAPKAAPSPPDAPLPPDTTVIGQGGVDGFVAAARDGMLHLVFGGKYRQGLAPDRLGPEETITDLQPVNTVRIAVDAKGRPHVVFTTGQTSKATRSYYTTRIGQRWLPAEKIADVAEIPDRTRAYVADVAADEQGNVLACYWISRPDERRGDRDAPAFHYRWRLGDGCWGEALSLPSHWSSAPKVEHQPGRGFFLLWQSRGSEWRIAGPAAAGEKFAEARSFSTGSNRITGVSTVQNEGPDFSVAPDDKIIVAGNVREAFQGPVGVWAAVGPCGTDLTATYLGSFAGTKRGDESAVHPVAAWDLATGAAFVTVLNPKDRRGYFAVYRPDGGWQRSYTPLLPDHPAPQGTLRQGPSVADTAGPRVVALVRDGEERWYLRVLPSP